MRITSVRAAPLRDPSAIGRSGPEAADWFSGSEGENPLSRYERYRGQAFRFHPDWPEVVCVATADDGTWGLGMTAHAGPVVPLINEYLAAVVRDEDALETERVWDVMAAPAPRSSGRPEWPPTPWPRSIWRSGTCEARPRVDRCTS